MKSHPTGAKLHHPAEITREDVDLDIDLIAFGQAGERRRTGRVRDDVDGETHPVGQILHIVHRQRHAVERYRALGRTIGRDRRSEERRVGEEWVSTWRYRGEL